MRRRPDRHSNTHSSAGHRVGAAALERLAARRFRSVGSAFRQIAGHAIRWLDAAQVSVWLVSHDRQRLNCVYTSEHRSVFGPSLNATRYPRIVQLLKTDGLCVAADTPAGRVVCDRAMLDRLAQLGCASTLIAAIFIDKEFVGVICHDRRQTRDWGVFEREQARRLAEIAARAIAGARARQPVGFAARLMQLVDDSVDAVGMASARGGLEYLNTAARDILGLAPDEPIAGLRLSDFLPAAQRRRVLHTLLSAARDHESWTGRLAMVTRQNDAFEATITIRFHHGAGLREGYISLSIRELAERQEIERRVNEVRARYEKAFMRAGDGVIRVAPATGRVLDADYGFEQLLGYAPEQHATLTLAALMANPAVAVADYLERTQREGHLLCGEQALVHARGRPVHAEMSMLRTQWRGQPIISVRLRDVSELVDYRRDIERLAYYDPLTGLANGNLLRERAEAMLAHSLDGGRAVYFVLLQVDRWERVFDVQGYRIAESLIRQIGVRLRRAFKAQDVLVARVLGGVEMGLLFECDGANGQLEEHIARAHRVFETAFRGEGQAVHLRVRSGSARAPLDAVNFKDLSKRAGLALRSAHLRGLHHCSFDVAQTRGLQDEHLLEEDLRRAIDSDQLSLRYQPIQRLVPDQRRGAVEVLVRWQHPTLGEVAPADFIPLAEDSRLVVAIDRRSLNVACRAAARWRGALEALRVSINISAVTLLDPGVVAIVRAALDDAGLDPARLCLEITETSVIRDRLQAAAVLRELHGLGVFIALDDFGTGYSSLAYLKDLPVDVLKIDRDFVRGIGTDTRDERAIETIIELGHGLGMRVVAEGVETRAQYRWLTSRRVDYVQGYYIAMPLTLAELSATHITDMR